VSGQDPWPAIDRLIDRATRLEDLRRHGLQLLAGRRFRASGRRVEPQLVHDEQLAAAVALSAPRVLERVRAAYDGPIVLMKGPEIARLYPAPHLRAYGDMDLLVDDAEHAQRALLAAGFRAVGDPRLYVDIHHLRPLLAPGLAVPVEVHDRPKWPAGERPPATEELISRAVPSEAGVDGILTPPPAEHALLVAAHSWAHVPLGRLSHLLDADLLAANCAEVELRSLSTSWRLERIWQVTAAAADTLFRDEPRAWPLRTWARNLPAARERTVLERHLEEWLAPYAAAPARRALGASAAAFVGMGRRQPDEAWRAKLRRTARALRSPSVRLSEHGRALAAPERRRR
jgi:hypothetical protein